MTQIFLGDKRYVREKHDTEKSKKIDTFDVRQKKDEQSWGTRWDWSLKSSNGLTDTRFTESIEILTP